MSVCNFSQAVMTLILNELVLLWLYGDKFTRRFLSFKETTNYTDATYRNFTQVLTQSEQLCGGEFGSLTQLVEYRAFNTGVTGSKPVRPTQISLE